MRLFGASVVVTRLRWGDAKDEGIVQALLEAWRKRAERQNKEKEKEKYSSSAGPGDVCAIE